MQDIDKADRFAARLLGNNLEGASVRMVAYLFVFSLFLALLLKL